MSSPYVVILAGSFLHLCKYYLYGWNSGEWSRGKKSFNYQAGNPERGWSCRTLLRSCRCFAVPQPTCRKNRFVKIIKSSSFKGPQYEPKASTRNHLHQLVSSWSSNFEQTFKDLTKKIFRISCKLGAKAASQRSPEFCSTGDEFESHKKLFLVFWFTLNLKFFCCLKLSGNLYWIKYLP